MKKFVTISEVKDAGVKNWTEFEKTFPDRKASALAKQLLDKHS